MVKAFVHARTWIGRMTALKIINWSPNFDSQTNSWIGSNSSNSQHPHPKVKPSHCRRSLLHGGASVDTGCQVVRWIAVRKCTAKGVCLPAVTIKRENQGVISLVVCFFPRIWVCSLNLPAIQFRKTCLNIGTWLNLKSIWRFPKMPKSSILMGYKSIWGYPHLWKPPFGLERSCFTQPSNQSTQFTGLEKSTLSLAEITIIGISSRSD